MSSMSTPPPAGRIELPRSDFRNVGDSERLLIWKLIVVETRFLIESKFLATAASVVRFKEEIASEL